MSQVLTDIKPKKVFKHFEEISQIPRCSGNEKEISDYMVSFAKKHDLEVIQDSVDNIIIKKEATKGYENSETIILQGHLDMVCDKDTDYDHDFAKDPLDIYVEGDLVKARGTTLGADNGVAIAYQMAILSDNTLNHPPLEMFMTIDEERGMNGVANMDLNNLDGKILINLDSENQGEFLASCAGGIRTNLEIDLETKKSSLDKLYKLSIIDLKGGHSGIEIHLERANSNILMGRLLQDLKDEFDIELGSIEGGTEDNVITRETNVKIGINEKDIKAFEDVILKWENTFKKEYRAVDPDISIKINELNKQYIDVFSDSTRDKVISALVLHPYGVQAMSHDMEGLVETSLNLGVVSTTNESIILSSALRSSSSIRKECLIKKLEELSNVLDAKLTKSANYPAWEYNPDSKIREIATKVYKEYSGKEPTISAIHAGLECGFLSQKLPGVDMISFGPNITGAHTIEESLSIKSADHIWNYLIQLLEKLK